MAAVFGALSYARSGSFASCLERIAKNDPSFTKAHLDNRGIGDNDAEQLADALERNTALTLLCLISNKIGDRGATELAERLKTNETLEKLYLGLNMIADGGMSDLVEMLQVNKSLKRLGLRSNNITNAGAIKLVEALQWSNSTITSLDLDGNSGISADFKAKIYRLVKINKESASPDGALLLKAEEFGGQGTLTFSNGRKCEGVWQEGRGSGTISFPDGTMYEGQWVKNGQREGLGSYTHPSGVKYEGGWKEDIKEDTGIFTWRDGSLYTGQYTNNERRGWEFQEEYKDGKLTKRIGPAIIALGPAGVGKSTIINTLLGEASAKSGVSQTGKGITVESAPYTVSSGILKNINIFDTAGWENKLTLKNAVETLLGMLKEGHQVKVVFVITLLHGRVGDNGDRIKEFITDVQHKGNKRFRFGVVINQTPEEMAPETRGSIEQLISYELDAEEVLMLKEEKDARGKDNKLLSSETKEGLEQFVQDLPAAHISEHQIHFLEDVLLKADACSLIYFYAELLEKGSSGIKDELTKDRTTFEDVIGILEKIPTEECDNEFEINLNVLKARYEENKKMETIHGQDSAFLSCVSQAGENGGLVYTVTVSPGFKRIILTFRGSVNKRDWYQNAQFLQRGGQHDRPVIRVHKGFQEYLEEKYDGIKRHLDGLQGEYGHCKICVTGHSLGGAIATLFSYRYASEPDFSARKGALDLVSFASPHVGDRSFSAAFKDLERRNALRHTRVTICSDPVPKLLSVAPYLVYFGKAVASLLELITNPGGLFERLFSGEVRTSAIYEHVGDMLSLECSKSLPGSGFVERNIEPHFMKTYINSVKAEIDELERQQNNDN